MAKHHPKHEPDDGLPMAPAIPTAGGAPHVADVAAPAHATPATADAGDLPRVVPELARAPKGCTRFKVRVRNYGEMGGDHRYILAREGDEAGACDCFLKATGLDNYIARLKKNAGAKADEVDSPEFSVTALAD